MGTRRDGDGMGLGTGGDGDGKEQQNEGRMGWKPAGGGGRERLEVGGTGQEEIGDREDGDKEDGDREDEDRRMGTGG